MISAKRAVLCKNSPAQEGNGRSWQPHKTSLRWLSAMISLPAPCRWAPVKTTSTSGSPHPRRAHRMSNSAWCAAILPTAGSLQKTSPARLSGPTKLSQLLSGTFQTQQEPYFELFFLSPYCR